MLELIEVTKERDISGNVLGLYKCSCGIEKLIANSRVNRGHTRSCGRLWRETARKKLLLNNKNRIHFTHGMRNSREYSSWRAMKQRCLNCKLLKYKNYGGRGIAICNQWINSFEQFYADMGHRPIGHSLDRIDNDGNYEPNNCRWADAKTQNNNTRITNKRASPKETRTQ